MSQRVLTMAVLLTVLGSALVALGATAVAAQTNNDQRPTAAVSLGDSYLSGEAGRWQGNSTFTFGDRNGTDRAAFRTRWFTRYNPEIVYGATAGGCQRSDVAPIHSADLAVDESINIACSGASTENVISTASGGQPFLGEDPQVDQLAVLAETHNIEVVVLSIGGNDLGFSNVIIDCVLRYSTSSRFSPNTCASNQQANITEALPGAIDGVATAIADIRSTMTAAGDSDYRLIIQNYPAPLPRGEDFRYGESGFLRLSRGCPFWNSDADWSNDWLIPTLSNNLAATALANGAEFLDVSNAFDGRQACAAGSLLGSGPDAEWMRFVRTGLAQGSAGESVHPNALGQVALGRCISLVVAQRPGDFACNNTANGQPDMMFIERQ